MKKSTCVAYGIKQIFTLVLVSILISSCTSIQSVMYADANMKKIYIGMTKERVISIMGKNYEALGARGNEVRLGYKAADEGTYVLLFVDGILGEWNKEMPQYVVPSAAVNPGYNPNQRENPARVNISIKKDILGTLVFNGENGKNASLRTDVLDNHIYTDSNGNKIEYGKDIWNGIIRQYDNEQALFIYLIEKHLYGYTDYPRRR